MKPSSLHKFIRSFVYAGAGFRRCWREERNFRIHFTVGILVVIAGVLLDITRMEWIAVALCIGIVPAAELVNSAIERLTNLISPANHPLAGAAKDMAAAAVLLLAIAAAAVGLLIFVPRLWALLG
jgi:diacylglycerol kinase (ATP)